jgi:hypothetical protein
MSYSLEIHFMNNDTHILNCLDVVTVQALAAAYYGKGYEVPDIYREPLKALGYDHGLFHIESYGRVRSASRLVWLTVEFSAYSYGEFFHTECFHSIINPVLDYVLQDFDNYVDFCVSMDLLPWKKDGTSRVEVTDLNRLANGIASRPRKGR